MSLFSFFTRGENYFYPPFFHRIRSGGREGAREQPFLTAQLSKKREGKIGGRVGNETDGGFDRGWRYLQRFVIHGDKICGAYVRDNLAFFSPLFLIPPPRLINSPIRNKFPNSLTL